jgi:membrane associated rhomboid family serine protease
MVIPLRDENPTHRTAYVTIALIAINIFFYFGVQAPKDSTASDLIRHASEGTEYTYSHAAIPCELDKGHPLTVRQFETDQCDPSTFDETRDVFPNKNVYVAILWSMFMHGSILHVLGNMLFLWIFGNNVEDRMGRVGYTIFYLAAGVVSAIAHVAFNLHSTVPVVGASGAIAGVMGAYIVWYPRARILSAVPIFLFFLIELPAYVVLGGWFVLQFFTNPNEGVAWVAHVGGFLFGALIAALLSPLLGRPPTATRTSNEPWWRRRRRIGGRWNDDGWDGGFRGGYPGRM